jgi:hypothetical protein
MITPYPIANSTEEAVKLINEGQTLAGIMHLPTAAGPHPAV